jgi:hypothetical protein
VGNDWNPKGSGKESEAAKKVGDRRGKSKLDNDAFLRSRLSDRMDDGVGQRDAIKQVQNGCENSFTLSNWTPTYELNRNSYTMDNLANLVMTGFSEGCLKSVSPVSAGLVQGLNYDYFIYDPSSNYTISASSATALDTTNMRLTLDCDGSYPVVILHGCLRIKGTSAAILTSMLANGTDDAAGNRATYNSDAGINGDTGLSIFPASSINVGSNTFDLAAHVEGGGSGTIYGAGTGTNGNRLWAIAVELKTVEGQITQAKVDNRTVWSPTIITDWDNRPTNPVNDEIIGYRVLQDASVSRTSDSDSHDPIWWLRYDEGTDRWYFSHGSAVWWHKEGINRVLTNTWTTYSDIEFAGAPDGQYMHEWTSDHAALVTTQAQTVRTRLVNDTGSTTGNGIATSDMSTGTGGISGQDYSVSWSDLKGLTSGQGSNYFRYQGYAHPTNDGQLTDMVVKTWPEYLDN